jgi:hypothetical protein
MSRHFGVVLYGSRLADATGDIEVVMRDYCKARDFRLREEVFRPLVSLCSWLYYDYSLYDVNASFSDNADRCVDW